MGIISFEVLPVNFLAKLRLLLEKFCYDLEHLDKDVVNKEVIVLKIQKREPDKITCVECRGKFKPVSQTEKAVGICPNCKHFMSLF